MLLEIIAFMMFRNFIVLIVLTNGFMFGVEKRTIYDLLHGSDLFKRKSKKLIERILKEKNETGLRRNIF